MNGREPERGTDPGASLGEALRHRWASILVATIAVSAGATWYAERLPDTYTATSFVAIAPRPANASADVVRLVAPTFVEYALAPSTIDEVAAEVGRDPGEVDDAIEVTLQAETGNVSLQATWGEPEAARSLADAFAERTAALADGNDLVRAEILVPAVAPQTPSGPPRRLFEASGLLLGLGLGVGLAVLLERRRPRVRHPDQLRVLTGQGVVAKLPRRNDLRSRPREAFAAAAVGMPFRTLRANLGPGPTVLGVTSPNHGDGTTTTAAMTAEAFARSGRRVLLFDADMRRAELAQRFGLLDAAGTADVLRGKADLADAIQEGWVDGLDVLAASTDADAGDLLSSSFADAIASARDRYDVVIVDLPPVLHHEDAAIAVSSVDGLLLVIDGSAPVREVQAATDALELMDGAIVGVVVNRAPSSAPRITS